MKIFNIWLENGGHDAVGLLYKVIGKKLIATNNGFVFFVIASEICLLLEVKITSEFLQEDYSYCMRPVTDFTAQGYNGLRIDWS